MGSDRYFILDFKNKSSDHFQNEIVPNMEDRASSNLDLFYGSRVTEVVRSSMALSQ